jgi:hypothetical protein
LAVWKRTFATSETYAASSEDVLVVAAPDDTGGTVSRLDPATGEPVWSTDVAVTSRPALGGGLVVVPGPELSGLDLETGAQLWAVPSLDDGTFFMPAFTGHYIEVATTDANLELREPDDGALVTYRLVGTCEMAMFEVDDVPFASCSTGLVAFTMSGTDGWQLVDVLIPQGNVDSAVVVPGVGIAFSTGIGSAPDGVLVVRPQLP